MKRCNACAQEKPTDDFYPNRSTPDGLARACRPCSRASVAKSRRKHIDKRRAEERAARRIYVAKVGKDVINAKVRECNRKVRDAALAAYGGKCACCGEATPEFLCIDHVREDGFLHRKSRAMNGSNIYWWLKKQGYPQDGRFQVLCHNCNMAKSHYGGCPHNGPSPHVSLKLRTEDVRMADLAAWLTSTHEKNQAARRERLASARSQRGKHRAQAGQVPLFGAAS